MIGAGKKERILVLFIIPALAIYCFFYIYPMFSGLYYSLTNYYLQYPHLFRVLWLDNYLKLVQDQLRHASMRIS